MLKHMCLVIVGILVSLIFVESFFHIIKYPILFDKAEFFEEFDQEQFIKSMYIEIYDNFFTLKDNYYVAQRTNVWQANDIIYKFSKKKDKDTKRIFIVGESVARLFDCKSLMSNLQNNLDKNIKFEIINVGSMGYESFRIERLVKEIAKNYEPDYIVMCIGNNDGILYKQITINYLPYKYKIFRVSYVLNYLSNFIISRYRFNMENVFPFFEKNIIKMVNDTKGKCSIIFVTLPQNTFCDVKDESINDFNKIFPKMLEKEYSELDRKYYEQRRNFIRTLPEKYNWIFVADFDRTLKKYVKEPAFDIFHDSCHYYPPVYDFISKLIVEQILEIRIDISDKYVQNILKSNVQYMLNYGACSYYAKAIICDIIYKNNPNILENTINSKINDKEKYVQTIAIIYTLIINNNEKISLKYLNKVIINNPDRYEAYMLKALANYRLGNRKLAKENFDIATKTNPKNKINLKSLDDFYKNNKSV